jgi:hypothetical protein
MSLSSSLQDVQVSITIDTNAHFISSLFSLLALQCLYGKQIPTDYGNMVDIQLAS